MTGPADWTDGVPRLVVSRCAVCGYHWYFRRPRCPRCGSPRVTRGVSTGAGTVAARTVLHPASAPPFGVCLVDLDEGVRVLARCARGLGIGEAVVVGFEDGVPHARGIRPPHAPGTGLT
ncbi:Zn-ribbon domain-containing OB-fold protein [Pseudonocardia sichuanensis]